MINKGFKRRYHHISRYKEIAKILTKYGFSMIADNLQHRPIFSRLISLDSKKLSEKYPRGVRVRMAFEELGPTFIKLGQILSTRYDLLPKDIVEALDRLQDHVPEFEFNEAKNILEKELGCPIEDVFQELDPKPIAAASIGQVYRGTLKTGERIVVKIQRPNIEKIIEIDLHIMRQMADFFDDKFKKRVMNYKEVVSEFSYLIRKELDYTYEGQNCENFRMKFHGDHRIVIPKVYWKYTTKHILITEEIKGVKLSDIKGIDLLGLNKKKLAQRGAELFLEQIFIHGYFHGDPHPGNLFVLEDGKIALIDFGIVGYLDKETLKFITDLLRSGVKKDATKIIESLEKMGSISPSTDRIRLKKDFNYLLNYYYNVPLDKLNVTDALNDLLQIAYEHSVQIPSSLVLLIKSTMTIEGTGKKLNPSFSMTELSNQLLSTIRRERLKPKNIMRNISEISLESFEDFYEVPKLMKQILFKLERGEINLTMKQEGIKELEKEFNKMNNNISLSLLVAAIIVGSSIVIQSKTGPMLMGMSAIGLIGFLAAAVLGVFIVGSILISMLNNKKI